MTQQQESEVNIVEIIKIAAVLALLVYMTRKQYQLGHVLFISALFFGILHNLSPWKLGSLIFTSLSSPSALIIFAALYIINLMEFIMRHSGLQNRMVNGLKNLSGDPRIAMAALPAIIGLLPSPGGARFSAPMVEEAALDVESTGEQKAAINYFYRHIWEYTLPLYPTNLLAVEILQIPLNKYILVMLPFNIITILAGILIFRGVTPIQREREPIAPSQSRRNALEGFTPFIVIMVLVLFFKLHILLSLLLVVTIMFFFYKIPGSLLPTMLKSAISPRLFYMIFSCIYVRDVLMSSGSIQQLMDYFNAIGLGPLMITTILPFTIGLLTGQVIPGITIVFPVIATMATPDNILRLGSLAFVTNFVGNMLSPLHLCFIMSIEHFDANFIRAYRKLILPEAIILLFAGIYYFLL